MIVMVSSVVLDHLFRLLPSTGIICFLNVIFWRTKTDIVDIEHFRSLLTSEHYHEVSGLLFRRIHLLD